MKLNEFVDAVLSIGIKERDLPGHTYTQSNAICIRLEDATVAILDSTQGPSEMAEELIKSFGVDHCAALGQLLLTFVQAERMRGQATIQEIIEQSEQYGAYL